MLLQSHHILPVHHPQPLPAHTIRLYGLEPESIVDGAGYRTAIFVQGCPHHCKGCHNPGSHDANGGTIWTLDEIEAKFSNHPLLDGITLTGGEPFTQPAQCAALARSAHAMGQNVWTYSGYTLEQLYEMSLENADMKALLDETDVLIDGLFVLEQRSLDLLFRGSRNQRLIDMRQTRITGRLALWEPEAWI